MLYYCHSQRRQDVQHKGLKSPKSFTNLPLHSGRSYYIDLLLIKMAVLAMFQKILSQIKIPSTNRQQFPKHGIGHFSNQSSKSQPNDTKLELHHSSFQTKKACSFQPEIKPNHGFELQKNHLLSISKMFFALQLLSHTKI